MVKLKGVIAIYSVIIFFKDGLSTTSTFKTSKTNNENQPGVNYPWLIFKVFHFCANLLWGLDDPRQLFL